MSESDEEANPYVQGQKVFVKPGVHSLCDVVWPVGTVTRDGNGNQVEVNGIPRHLADVRGVAIENTDRDIISDNSASVSNDTECIEQAMDRPRRDRRPPGYLDDYVV